MTLDLNSNTMPGSHRERALYDMLSAMREQESSSYYKCCNYLEKCHSVDQASRQQICEWMYVVVDHFGTSRDVVGSSIFLLDLFLSKNPVNSHPDFKLAAMACLFLSMKLQGHAYYESGIELKTLVKLSRGLFTAAQVEQAELRLLFVLKWKIHPPTRSQFLQVYLQMLPSMSCHTRYKITEVSRFLLEMSQCVYKFCLFKPSVASYAAILIAMDEIVDKNLSIQQIRTFTRRMSRVAKLEHTSSEVATVACELQQLLLDQDTNVKTLMKSLEYPVAGDDKNVVGRIDKKGLNRQTNSASPRDVMGRKIA